MLVLYTFVRTMSWECSVPNFSRKKKKRALAHWIFFWSLFFSESTQLLIKKMKWEEGENWNDKKGTLYFRIEHSHSFVRVPVVLAREFKSGCFENCTFAFFVTVRSSYVSYDDYHAISSPTLGSLSAPQCIAQPGDPIPTSAAFYLKYAHMLRKTKDF